MNLKGEQLKLLNLNNKEKIVWKKCEQSLRSNSHVIGVPEEKIKRTRWETSSTSRHTSSRK